MTNEFAVPAKGGSIKDILPPEALILPVVLTENDNKSIPVSTLQADDKPSLPSIIRSPPLKLKLLVDENKTFPFAVILPPEIARIPLVTNCLLLPPLGPN